MPELDGWMDGGVQRCRAGETEGLEEDGAGCRSRVERWRNKEEKEGDAGQCTKELAERSRWRDLVFLKVVS